MSLVGMSTTSIAPAPISEPLIHYRDKIERKSLFLFNFGNTFAFDLFNQKLQCINNMWSDVAAYQHIHYVVAKFKLAFIKPKP